MLMKLLPLTAIMLFNGCGSTPDPEPEIRYIEKKIYIKAKERKLINKPRVEPYIITDIHDYNATHVLVNDEQLQHASKVSMERFKKIVFYENQNRGINAVK